MKRFYLIITILLGVSSCTKSLDTEIQQEESGITFDNRVEGATRVGSKSNSSWIPGDDFAVFASSHVGELNAESFNKDHSQGEQLFFAHLKVYNTNPLVGSATWDYEGSRYTWPVATNTFVSFVAIHPMSSSEGEASLGASTVSNSEVVQLAFVPSNDPTKQIDIMWDVVENASKAKPSGKLATDQTGDNSTKFTFKHALSKITFRVVAGQQSAGETLITLSSLKLQNVVGYNTVTSISGTVTPSTGVLAWTDYSLGTDEIIIYDKGTSEGLQLNGLDVADMPNPLLMLPQQLTAATGSDPANPDNATAASKISITYKIASGGEIVKDVYIDTKWLINTQYIYTISINFNTITFNTSEIVGWIPANSEDVNTLP